MKPDSDTNWGLVWAIVTWIAAALTAGLTHV